MSLVNSEWLRLIRQFAEMALDLEATKEDIRHEYHAWFAKPTINTCRPRSYMDNEIFNKVARIMDLEARVLARVTDEHRPLAVQVFQLVQRWLEQLDTTTRRYVFEGGPSRQRFVDKVVQYAYTMRQINT